jgi:hypothetical protein
MSVSIDDIIYQIEDEELSDIEYFEILTMGEIIKHNPTFIAFTREEIYNELYDFFEDSNKSENIADLFFKNKMPNLQNYVFVVDAYKKQYECEDEDIGSFVDTMNKMTKLSYNVAQIEKHKLMFAITYDNDETKLRLKPKMYTNIQFTDDNILYPVFKDDDTNIPVTAAYFKTPIAVIDDALSQKVIAYLEKPLLFNLIQSDTYTDVDKLVKAIKPKIDTILQHIKIDDDDYDVDYNHLNSILRRFDTSLDDLTENDFKPFLENLKHISSDVLKISYKKFKLQPFNVVNDKLEFFNKLNKKHLLQLLNIPDKTKEELILLIANLEEEKMNINAPPLLYNNINDILQAVVNNDVTLEDIVDNLSDNKKTITISHAINTLKDIIANDIESIDKNIDNHTERERLLHHALNVFFKFQFIDFYADIKEIKEATDYSDYDGIPDVYKNNGKYEGMALNDDQDNFDTDDVDETLIKSSDSLDKYWLSIKYKDAYGFVESLKFILPLIKKIYDNAKLPLNYERLCDELFRIFASISTKYDLMKAILNKADIKLTDDFVHDIVKISPLIALNTSQINSLVSDDLIRYVHKCNQDWVTNILDMLLVALAWWSLQIQDDIVNDILVYQENDFMISYVDKWALDGLPLKDSKQGVTVYLCSIFDDIIIDNNLLYLQSASLQKEVMKKIDDLYKEFITDLRENAKDISKKRNYKGKETYTQLLHTIKDKLGDRLLNDYINALLYMPSYKYKQLHKFLLGCCLQQIGKSFVTDKDIMEKERKDLQVAKKKYGKTRLTQPSRYALYVAHHKEDDSDSYESDEEYDNMSITVSYEIMDIVDDNAIQNWLNNMKNNSVLLPNNDIEHFLTSTKDALTYAKHFIQIFCKTAGFKSQELDTLILDHNPNVKNILLMLCSIYKKTVINLPEEEQLLKNAIATIHDIIRDIDNLVKISNEYNAQDILRIKKYILCRALCLPCNVNINTNGILSASINVTNGFVTNLMKLVYTTVTRYLRFSKMPTIEENIAFITKIREENKRKILQVMDTKTADERNLINAIKKIGLKYEDDDDNELEMNPYNINDDYNDFEKDELILKDQEEYDDLDDDIQDYGFIYS